MNEDLKRFAGPVIFISLALSAGGCATIRTYHNLQQSVETPLVTDLNGQVFKVVRTSDLPNAFGKADAFSGKVDRGFIELRYLGLAADGRLRFRMTDIETASTETTMTRYGAGQVHVTSSTTTTSYGSWTTATGVYIPPPEGRIEMLPPNTLEFLYDRAAGPLRIGGVQVTFLSASEMSLSYRLHRFDR